MDKQTFRTRKEAQEELDKMAGWNARISQLFQPDDPNANRNGNVFVIRVQVGTGDPQYLRQDGYVR